MLHAGCCWIVLLAASAPPNKIQMPVCKDPSLEVALFASEPEIMTPTGITALPDGSLLVVENHTHFPLKDYPGPKFDRIFRFVEKDGKPYSRNIFADGLQNTMGVIAHPDGSVWVACHSAIYRFVDKDGDGVADEKKEMIRLETKGDYPHNGLNGFSVEPTKNGDLYFGIGENFGESFKLHFNGGVYSSSGGEGGSVFRCRYDGTHVERFAFGFWNPFYSCLDGYGRLFVVDNDPDDRPPCRLLHVVLGGDYGYRFRNGRRGIHPFTAWNGELPGTLPMVSGTGEAPSGIIHIASDALGVHNRDALIGTSWGDHRLERFRLVPRGASFQSQPEPIVTGGDDFRPVGICADKLGNLWFTDWVDKSYNVHGKGRIWRLRAKERPKTPVVEERLFARFLNALHGSGDAGNPPNSGPDRTPETLAMLIRHPGATFGMDVAKSDKKFLADSEVLAEMMRRTPYAAGSLHDSCLQPKDAFIYQAALVGIAKSATTEQVKELMESTGSWKRLAGVLVHRMQDPTKHPHWLIPRFDDSDPAVQFAAIQSVGEYRIKSLRPQVAALLESGKATGQLFLACTAALDDLDRVKKNASDEFSAGDVLVKFVVKPNAPTSLIKEALPFIPANHPALKIDLLDKLLANDDDWELRDAAILILRERAPAEAQPRLIKYLDTWRFNGPDEALRSGVAVFDAIDGLSPSHPPARALLIQVAVSGSKTARREALRSLRGANLSEAEITRLKEASTTDATSLELVQRLRGRKPMRQTATDTAVWLAKLQGNGDVAAGRRIFFHPNGPGCYKCHRMGDRGGLAGPDLSAIGGSMTRERIVESILQPSKEIAPMFIPWTLVMNDGTTKIGLFVGGTNNNTQVYVDSNGQRFEVRPEDVENRKPAKTSIMPAELIDTLTDQEFRDLLAYLEKAKRP